MVQGRNTTGNLADSLPLVIDGARIRREYEGVFTRTVDKQTLPEGTGLSWEEVTLEQLTAQGGITENTILENPQQVVDSLFSITPTVAGIHTFFTDRVQRRIAKQVWAKVGGLSQNAMNRKKDEDYLTVLDGATTSLCGAGNTLASGHISAARTRITSNTTEPGRGELFAVLRGEQIKDIQDEVVAGVGTYTVPTGMTEETFRKGFMGSLFGCNVFEDGNISIDASDDCKGGVHTREAIVLVQGHSPRSETRREPHIGGGGDSMWLYDEFAFGERSSGNWLVEIYSDSTSPTS